MPISFPLCKTIVGVFWPFLNTNSKQLFVSRKQQKDWMTIRGYLIEKKISLKTIMSLHTFLWHYAPSFECSIAKTATKDYKLRHFFKSIFSRVWLEAIFLLSAIIHEGREEAFVMEQTKGGFVSKNRFLSLLENWQRTLNNLDWNVFYAWSWNIYLRLKRATMLHKLEMIRSHNLFISHQHKLNLQSKIEIVLVYDWAISAFDILFERCLLPSTFLLSFIQQCPATIKWLI